MKKVDEAIIAGVIILYANGEPATGKTVTAKVYDEAYALFSEPAVSEITGTGVYYATFTPDAEGLWTIIFDCADPNVTRAYSWYVQEQVADDIDAIEAKQDIIDTVVDAVKVQTDKLPRVVSHMDFWSDNDDEIAITTVSGNLNLPNCVVAGLPANITIIRVVALLKIAIIKDTSGSDNAVNSATMALKVDAASDYSSTVTAIDIPDDSWAVDVSEATERGGDGMIGDNDIKAEVTGNATYYARFENAACDGNNLKLKDVGWGLRIYFTV